MSGSHRLSALWKLCRAHRLLTLLLLAGVLVAVHGCTRAFYRRSADREVNDILAEKDHLGKYKIEQFHVYPDPRARFGDPTRPDRPPQPPDDEEAFQLAPHPQRPGHAGVGNVEGTGYLELMKEWDRANRAELARAADNTAAEQTAADKTEDGAPTEKPAPAEKRGALQELYESAAGTGNGFLLTMDQAVELGLINSREYQSVREDLYVAALAVTQQRFSFAWQWAATETAIRNWAGFDAPLGQQNNWSLGTTASGSKLFSTGALLTAAFANNTVFNFLGNAKGFTSASTINLDLIQPLLRGGGRAVTLEPLTQSERTLVYGTRVYYRFREQFYTSIAVGTTPPGTLLSAIGSGSSAPISALASLGIASTDVAGPFRGYLPSLYRELDMAVDRKYVVDLEKALRLLEGFQEGGQIGPLQVAQTRSTLYNARNGVLKDIQDKNNALDQFKLQLGLPANTPLLLDDTPGRPITRQLDRYYEVLTDSETASRQVDRQDQLPPQELRAYLKNLFTKDQLVQGTAFKDKVLPVWATWADDKGARTTIAAATALGLGGTPLSLGSLPLAIGLNAGLTTRLEVLRFERRRLLDLKTDLELEGKTLSAEQAKRMRDNEFESDLGELEQSLRDYERQSWLKLPAKDQRGSRTKSFRLASYAAQIVLVWARNDRYDEVGKHWPALPKTPLDADFDLQAADSESAQERAVEAALRDRVDVMNARAQVVDAWRQLRVTANALMGVFNVQYHLDTSTPFAGSNPLAFATGRSHQELILNAQLPLVRIAERNAYRIALINYQRARRNLMNLEDNIAAQVRFDVRQLHLFAENYKIQQKVLESLYSQVENALEVIVAPVDPDALKSAGTASQANAAALTSQYLGALQSLNGAQTRMYDLWLSYLATRIVLYLDLERLPLDSRGVWTDESGITRQPDPERGPTPLPGDFNGGSAGQRGPLPELPRPRFLTPATATPME